MNDFVFALTAGGGKLIAGGIFTTAGGVDVNYIAFWNGNSWSSPGSDAGGDGAPGWRFTLETGSVFGGLNVVIYALDEDLHHDGFLGGGSCNWPFDTICAYEGTIPNSAYGLGVYLDGGMWRSPLMIAAVRAEGGGWVVQSLGPWVKLNIGRARLTLPLPVDTSGTFDSLHVFVNLEEWNANPQPMLNEYTIIAGACPELPGFLIGTTPFVFDSLAPPEENPFSTTPFTGIVQRRGDGGLLTSCCFDRGDVDDSGGGVDISDLVYLVDFMFAGGPEPPCSEEADIDGSGEIDISDLVYLVDYMFTGGPAPVACL